MSLIKNKYFILLFFVFLIAIFLRFYKLGVIPAGTYWDETAILADAKVLSKLGIDMHGNHWYQLIFPSYGDYKLPVYIWFATIFVKFFGIGAWQLRLTSALAGILTIAFTMLISSELANKVFNNKAKARKTLMIFAATIIATCPWSIMFSRTGFEGHLAQMFLAASVYLLLIFQRKRNYIYLVISVILAAVSTYTYFSVRFVWPGLFLVFQITYLFNSTTVIKERNLKRLAINLVLFLVSPIIIFYLSLFPMFKSPFYAASNQFRLSTQSVLNSHDYPIEQNILREKAGNTIFDRLVFHRDVLIFRELVRNYSDNLSPKFIFLEGDPNLRHGTTKHGLFFLSLLPILILGLYITFKKSPATALSLLTWWIFALLPASVPENTPHALRSLNALVPISILMAFGATYVFEKSRKNKSFKILLISLSIGFFLEFFAFTYHYFNFYPQDSAIYWQNGYKQMAEFIYEHKDADSAVFYALDDKLFLWYIAYTPISADEIVSLKREDFYLNKYDNIYFNGMDWGKILNDSETLAIVGVKSQLIPKIEESGRSYEILESSDISNNGINTQYSAMLIKFK